MAHSDDLPPFPVKAFWQGVLASLAAGLAAFLVSWALGLSVAGAVWAALAALAFGWLGEAFYRFLRYDPSGRG